MTPAEAAKILDLPADTSPEQLEARFQELRAKLEDKIAKAPTPGLKAKYRESLDEITTAFETLTLAADSSSLPVTSKTANVGSPLAATSPSRSAQAPTLHSKPKSGGKEFILVAAIAVVLLGAGGWFVMKTRAENAEKARVAAEQKAEADRQAEAARVAAEAKKKAEEEEKARALATAKAEEDRLGKLSAQVRTKLAELRISWDVHEQDLRSLERKVGDLKSDERNLANQAKGTPPPELLRLRAELAATTDFASWLGNQLLRHPARIARVQAEELLSARQIDDAAAAVERTATELARLDGEIAASRRDFLTLTGPVQIEVSPASATWALRDAYGSVRKGQGNASLRDVPFGAVRIDFLLNGYEQKQVNAVLLRGKELRARHEFVAPRVTLDTTPSGAEIWVAGRKTGSTPATFDLPDERKTRVEFRLAGYKPRTIELNPADPAALRQTVALDKAPPVITEADYATVYLYRVGRFVGMAIKYELSLNGQPFFTMKNDIAVAVRLKPGRYQITGVSNLGGSIDGAITVLPRQTYYFQGTVSLGMTTNKFDLKQVPEDEARAALARIPSDLTPRLLTIDPLP